MKPLNFLPQKNVLTFGGHYSSSAFLASSHRAFGNDWHLGQCLLRHELYDRLS